jgi:hypothetical protein
MWWRVTGKRKSRVVKKYDEATIFDVVVKALIEEFADSSVNGLRWGQSEARVLVADICSRLEARKPNRPVGER